jgi:Holliday junction resolvase
MAKDLIEAMKLLRILKPEFGHTRSTHYRIDSSAAKEVVAAIQEVLDGKVEQAPISFE